MTTTATFFPQGSDDNNPYQRELANGLRRLGITVEGLSYRTIFFWDIVRQKKPVVLHLHWLHSFLVRTTLLKSLASASLFVTQIILLKLAGVKIVWTVHNLKNHDNQHLKLERFFTSIVAKLCNAIIVHGDSVKNEVASSLGLKNNNRIHSVPHGNYLDCYPNTISHEKAKAELQLTSEPTFLFLGLIRPYKGVIELMEAFEAIEHPQVKNARLLIAGKIWSEDPDFRDRVIQKVNETPNVTLISEFIPDDQLQLYFNACDAVIFPYKDILTSGAVLLAMSFGKACIAPRLGCIKDTLDDEGAVLYEAEDINGLSKAIQHAIEIQSSLKHKGRHNLGLAKQLTWRYIGELTQKVYQS